MVGLFTSSYFNPARDEEVTARLETLMNVVRMWDDDIHSRLKNISVSWELIDGQVVPNLDVEFFQSSPKELDPK